MRYDQEKEETVNRDKVQLMTDELRKEVALILGWTCLTWGYVEGERFLVGRPPGKKGIIRVPRWEQDIYPAMYLWGCLLEDGWHCTLEGVFPQVVIRLRRTRYDQTREAFFLAHSVKLAVGRAEACVIARAFVWARTQDE